MATKTPYLRLGIFVVAGMLLLVVGIFLIGKQKYTFAKTFEVEAQFNNASGIRKGAPVRVAGVEKGVVNKLLIPEQPAGKARVIMKMDEDTRKLIGPDAVAHIKSQGFFGERYIEIEIGDQAITQSKESYIVIKAEEAEDFDMLVTKANQTIDSLHQTVEEYGNVARKLNAGEGSIGQLLNDKELYQK